MTYFDLGPLTTPISTTSPEAQVWFDRGLIWTYGYNHEEAIACFEQAVKCDPDCAMAQWGIAYAAGPNYNMPWHVMDRTSRSRNLSQAHAATQAAMAKFVECSTVEQALITALASRYPQADIIDDMDPWNDDFADAMRGVYQQFPDDLTVITLFAEALLNRTPWKMWDLASGAPADGSSAMECQAVLERAMEQLPAAMDHPGLLHLYVHLMEMSSTPEKALKAGDRLRTLVPDSGHLIHMPTHIDVLCGHYQNVVHWNEVATEADAKFLDHAGAMNLYTGYRIHNYHFAIYGAMFLGQFGPAMRGVEGIRQTVPQDVLRIESPPMADYYEAYLGFEPHVLIRFGRWRDATELALPEDQTLYSSLTANVWYARGIGHAALGEVAEAEAAQAAFEAARGQVSKRRRLHNNRVIDLLEIAAAMLEGEIAYRKGEHAAAYAALRRSVELEDGLPYDEPWGWMQPSRHALGALLFEQGHLEEAEQVFREDLGLGGSLSRAQVHPDNIWALKGLHDCLAARGETEEIGLIRQRLDLANARADRPAAAPCFCARAAMDEVSTFGQGNDH